MGFHLSPETLEACYDLLRTVPPYKRWRLPPGNEIEFKVSIQRHLLGAHTKTRHYKEHTIIISAARNRHLATVLRTMAHEMIHLYQAHYNRETAGASHNEDFWRCKEKAGRLLGFDPGEL